MGSEARREGNRQDNASVTDVLQEVLNQTFNLAVITLNFHWNVEGRRFYDLHKLFEEQYDEMWSSLDPLAERIRALGAKAFVDQDSLSSSPETVATPSAEMVSTLITMHADMASSLRRALDVAKGNDDEASIAILGERLLAHDKLRWMLESMAVDPA